MDQTHRERKDGEGKPFYISIRATLRKRERKNSWIAF